LATLVERPAWGCPSDINERDGGTLYNRAAVQWAGCRISHEDTTEMGLLGRTTGTATAVGGRGCGVTGGVSNQLVSDGFTATVEFAGRDRQRFRIVDRDGPPLAQEQRAKRVPDVVLVTNDELVQAHVVDDTR
jgi:hypothetical protein